MKRTVCIILMILVLFSVFADEITLPSVEATLRYDLLTTSYLFGFAETESEAKAKKDAYQNYYFSNNDYSFKLCACR